MPSFSYYEPAGNSTAKLVKTGNTHLQSLDVENVNTDTVVYIQLFDAAAVSDVTVGATTPDQTYQVNIGTGDGSSGGGLESGVRERYFRSALRFTKGLVFAVTKEREGSTTPTSNCPVNMTIE